MIAPKSLWKGLSKFKKLTKEARVSEDVGKLWLMKQAIWQIDSRTLKHIPRPNFHFIKLISFSFPMKDSREEGKSIIASRSKSAEPLTSKDSSEVSRTFKTVYRQGPLRWTSVLQVDFRCKRDGKVLIEEKKRECKRSQGSGDTSSSKRSTEWEKWLTEEVG
ncbi:unnamed protein product [Pocillopora meandrina]|uniref:Uncharacterized protein n=1 Tax=Pocillopora meandrina TaxID=46732 RepID=A0AAU9VTI2_9CNID|nr:unnamed protein product [Pocillopora meandrina]